MAYQDPANLPTDKAAIAPSVGDAATTPEEVLLEQILEKLKDLELNLLDALH